MGLVRVVTDSTAGLPLHLREPLGIAVVPLAVVVGDRTGLEGVDVSTADVAAALAAGQAVTTSQPSADALAEAWGSAGEVVSVHLSARLSGTFDAAVALARTSSAAVEVVDAGTTSMGLGFVALAAARVAAAGGSQAEVVAAAREAVQQTDTLLVLNSVDTLNRGGRLAGASNLVGSVLSVKPILQLVQGEIAPLERVRTSARGVQRLLELTLARTEGGSAEIAVLHLGSADRAEQLARSLDLELGDRLTELVVSEVGAVVGAHVGPGVLGVAIHRLPA